MATMGGHDTCEGSTPITLATVVLELSVAALLAVTLARGRCYCTYPLLRRRTRTTDVNILRYVCIMHTIGLAEGRAQPRAGTADLRGVRSDRTACSTCPHDSTLGHPAYYSDLCRSKCHLTHGRPVPGFAGVIDDPKDLKNRFVLAPGCC